MASVTRGEIIIDDNFLDQQNTLSSWDISMPFNTSSVVFEEEALLLRGRGGLNSKQEFNGTLQIDGRFKFDGEADVFSIVVRTDQSLVLPQFAEQAGVAVVFNQELNKININNVAVEILAERNFVFSKPEWITFTIRDDGDFIAVYLNGSPKPFLKTITSKGSGQKISLYNREFYNNRTRLGFLRVATETPIIKENPKTLEVKEGEDAVFSVETSGQGLEYQWRFEGLRLIGATEETLTLNNVTGQDVGSYSVDVSNEHGVVLSTPARLFLFYDSDGDGLSDNFEKGALRLEFVETKIHWDMAFQETAQREGHLATFVSEAEFEAFVEIFGDTLLGKDIWLGATDQSSEGNYVWVTGEPWGYTRWEAGEPNDPGGEDFIHIRGDRGFYTWNDHQGAHRANYLLEKWFYSDPFNADSDGDGFNDFTEYKHRTNPLNADDFPSPDLTIFPAVELEVRTENGVMYQLQISNDLTSWSNYEDPFKGTGETISKLVSTRKLESQYFRLVVIKN